MIKRLRAKLARLISPELINNLEVQIQAEKTRAQEVELSVNQRVAEIISKMDPLEPLLKEFHGVFSREYERPEDMLNPQGQFLMESWGYSQADDPSFKYLTDWIMNVHANETLRHAPVTTDRILYGRAQLAVMLLYKNEVQRLSQKYKDRLDKNKPVAFDETISTDG